MKLFVALILSCSCSPSLKADMIQIKGSDLLGAKVVPLLCQEYRRQHPGARFEIVAEGGEAFGPPG